MLEKLQHPKMPLWIVIGTLILDQATKLHMDFWFELGQSFTIIPGVFDLTYVRNPGAAFGILADSPWRLPFFISITVIAVIGLVWYLRTSKPEQHWLRLGLALILGGAIGNLIDRLWHGEVIDFIDVYWRQHHWPAFNVADSAICIGVGLMLLDLILEERDKKKEKV